MIPLLNISDAGPQVWPILSPAFSQLLPRGSAQKPADFPADRPEIGYAKGPKPAS